MSERPPRHALRRTKRRKKGVRQVRAGKLYFTREIAQRTGLTNDQVATALEAYHDLVRRVLLSGYRVRMTGVGEFGLTVKRVYNPADGTAFPGIILVGRCIRSFKKQWCASNFEAWAADQEEQGFEVSTLYETG